MQAKRRIKGVEKKELLVWDTVFTFFTHPLRSSTSRNSPVSSSCSRSAQTTKLAASVLLASWRMYMSVWLSPLARLSCPFCPIPHRPNHQLLSSSLDPAPPHEHPCSPALHISISSSASPCLFPHHAPTLQLNTTSPDHRHHPRRHRRRNCPRPRPRLTRHPPAPEPLRRVHSPPHPNHPDHQPLYSHPFHSHPPRRPRQRPRGRGEGQGEAGG